MVEGEKIVGESPIIPSGETFSYNSYHVTHLSAEAYGSFHGTDEFKNRIHINMKPFRLNIPGGGEIDPCTFMKFTDLNAHGGIGANCSLCELGPFKFVIDSGLHPKFAGPESLPRHEKSDDSPSISLSSHIVTLITSVALPLLSREQPDAPVF